MDTALEKKSKKMSVEKLFLYFALIFGLITIFVQPIFAAPDEFNHFKSANAVFHKDTDQIVGQVNQLTVQTPHKGPDLNKQALNEPDSSFAFESSYKDGTFFQEFFKDKVINTGNLSFNLSFAQLKWLPQAIGILIGQLIHPSFGVMIIAGRLVNFLLYLIIIYFAIKKAKFGQWFMSAVALLPISIQQATSLSYDVIYYAVIFACFSLLTNLWTRKEKLNIKWIVYCLVMFVALLIPKAAVLILFLLFLTVPSRLFGENKFTQYLDKFWNFWEKHKIWAFVIILIAFLGLISYEFRAVAGGQRGIQVLFNTFFRPDFYQNMDSILTSGMIGNFGQMTYRLPAWLIVVDFIFLFLLAFNEKEIKLNKRVAIASGIAYLLVLIMTAITMFLGWTLRALNIAGALISLGNQGRYYTPFLIILLPIAFQLGKYIKVEINPVVVRKIFKFIIIFNLVYFLALTVMFYYLPDRGANLLPNMIKEIKGLL